MAQTEITVQIFEDIKNVLAKLESMGFEWKDTFTGVDQYFTTLTPAKVKAASYKELLDSSIIIREFDKASTSTHQIMLVHKKKNLDQEGKVIGEEKTNTQQTLGVHAPILALQPDRALELVGLLNKVCNLLVVQAGFASDDDFLIEHRSTTPYLLAVCWSNIRFLSI